MPNAPSGTPYIYQSILPSRTIVCWYPPSFIVHCIKVGFGNHVSPHYFFYIYTPRNEVRGGILESPCPSVCPSVRLSVCPSVDARLGKMVQFA